MIAVARVRLTLNIELDVALSVCELKPKLVIQTWIIFGTNKYSFAYCVKKVDFQLDGARTYRVLTVSFILFHDAFLHNWANRYITAHHQAHFLC